MDGNGDKIEVVVKNYHISLWEPQLQEGQSYVDEDFDVRFANMRNVYFQLDVIGEFIYIEMSQPESMTKKVVFGI
ncbi:hypothetical protein Lal_00010746 [Lupinus albus]|nr:hypothetical protein Lal_00010746 [Lupinus albus]